ncbi:hypothetical protein [Aneurinibacillus migulanus]|uniref:Uncharacterized protein n=1 Tax=Aneurinibacillus migulanus TaxID=47500 RepID=A0A0D1VDA4_ANEMI|nr:hypothetical protein [Aneurinibacillus migulanus]KIV57439.1 hypothetical protein TS65_09345 [Aneurinibacillus migulanus]KON94950.1 hypothetical protein AF333_05080 [Aneurinibacillus migulanus]MED0892761.1 hypothetical protein [Aneurinibacillus migulanus]MED1619007.1 hypothetical protein [Aneurinibacillus migulanus]SDI95257.1 hypothetical protein SAMN04487909_109207 [Aneurinibacillus migulanus]
MKKPPTYYFVQDAEVLEKKVNTKYTDIGSFKEKCADIAEKHLSQIERRDLITNTKPEKKDKAVRVQYSDFWKHITFLGDKTLYIEENIQREEEKRRNGKRTREEWEEIERNYVKMVTGDIPTVTNPNYTVCSCWKCNTVFYLKHRRKKYCSERCANEQKVAVARLHKHGTLLPVKYYESYREGTLQDIYKEIEIPHAVMPLKNDLKAVGGQVKKVAPSLDSECSHKVRIIRFPPSDQKPSAVTKYNFNETTLEEMEASKWQNANRTGKHWRSILRNNFL